MAVALVSVEYSERSPQQDREESNHANWQHEWEIHHRRRHKQQLQRRAVLVLALVAEPAELQWDEVLQDTVFMAWKDAVEEARRFQAQTVEQRHFEEALQNAEAREKACEMQVLDTLHALRHVRAGMLLCEHGDVRISGERLAAFLQDLDETLTLQDAKRLAGMLPRSPDGHTSMNDVVCWLLGISSNQLASVVASWKFQHASWERQWQTHHTEQTKRHRRRRAILALSLIAQPLEQEWAEAHLDVMFSAWADFVADDHRSWSLSGPRRLFERELSEKAALHRSTSFHILSEIPGATSPVRQKAQQTLSQHGPKILTEEQFLALLRKVAPGMDQEQLQVLLHAVPRSHCGSIPVDGLMAWIFGTSVKPTI